MADNDHNDIILIVDDVLPNLEVLLDVLSNKGFEVLVAVDGESAIEQIQYARPDLILLDIMMPGIDGFETCRRLKANEKTQDIPIIFMSALSDTFDKVKAFKLGAVDYVTKPLQHEEVLARVDTHLTVQKLQKKLQDANDRLEKRVEERTADLVKLATDLVNLNEAYECFVPREFLSFLKKESILDVQLGDQIQQEMTILFADIQAFTSLSESMTPQENFNFINAYLKRVSPIIRTYNGFIDKYLGDGIMALFPQKAANAVECAIAMQQAVVEYNQQRQQKNYRPIKIRIGVHTGSLMLGIIGEAQRKQGTVISDDVNLASRLENISKMYGASIVISEQTLKAIRTPQTYNYRFVDHIQVKGRQKPVLVFEVFDSQLDKTTALKLKTKPIFEEGLYLYYNKQFAQASVKFTQVLDQNPDDTAAQLYLKRSANFMVNGVPPDWQGIEPSTNSEQ